MDAIKTPYYEFFKIEKEMNLFSLKYKDVSYWQLVRFGLLKKITTNKIEVANGGGGRSIKNEIVGAYKDSRRTYRLLDDAVEVDLIRIRPEVTLSNTGALDDHQYDYMVLDQDIKVMDLYALGNYVDVPKCVEFSMSPAEYMTILWKIKRNLLGEQSIDNDQKKILDNFVTQINEIYKMKFDLDSLEHVIQYCVASHIRYRDYYKKVLKKTRPKAIMVYPHYDEHMFSAIAAAKHMKIKVIEIQHGRINAHEAYWYEDQNTIGKLLPDYFFAYGEWWVEQTKMPVDVKLIVTGSTYLDAQMNQLSTQVYEKKILSIFSGIQTGLALTKFIVNNYEMLTNMNIEIWYKLHPNEFKIWSTAYPELRNNAKIKVITNEMSTYKIINDSDFILGINSTVFFEALAFKNKKIFILEDGDIKSMEPLILNGYAYKFKTANELKNLIENEYVTINSDKFEFWKDNAIMEVRRQINNVIMDSLRC